MNDCRTSLCRAVLTGMFFLSLATAANASKEARQDRIEMSDGVFDVSHEVVTPHIRWCKPSLLGPLRVLAIAPRWTHRESVELAQRFDWRITVFMSDRGQKLGDPDGKTIAYGSAHNRDRVAELMGKLEDDYDVILIGKVSWGALEPQVVDQILRHVRRGTGLVNVYYKRLRDTKKAPPPKALTDAAKPVDGATARAITGGVPWSSLAALKTRKPEDAILAGTLGKGRFLLVNHAERMVSWLLTYVTADTQEPYPQIEYEYYCSLAGKMVRWAARRDRAPTITVIRPRHAIAREKGRFPVRVAVNLQGRHDLHLECVIHDEEQRVGPSVRANVPGDGATLLVPIPDGPAGRWFVDVWLKDSAGRTADWGSVAVDVSASNGIESLSHKNPTLKPGQTLQASAKLLTAAGRDTTLRVRLFDDAGRLLAMQQGEVPSKMLSFSVKPRNMLSYALWLEAELVRGGRVIDRKRVQVPVSGRLNDWGYDDFSLLAWAGTFANGSEHMGRLLQKRIADLGADRFINRPGRYKPNRTWKRLAQRSAEVNSRFVPYAFRITPQGSAEKGLVRRPCLSDPKYVGVIRRYLRNAAQLTAAWGADPMSMGDEGYLAARNTDYCFDPSGRPLAMKMLKASYVTVEALNKSWGTNFRSWDELERTVRFKEAKEKGKVAQWVDHRLFMDEAYTEAYAIGGRAAQEVEPEMRSGFEGLVGMDTWHGYDIARLSRKVQFLNSYPVTWETGAMQVDFFPRTKAYIGYWAGSYPDLATAAFHKRIPWRCLFDGMNSIHYWATWGSQWFGFTDPDFTPNPLCQPFLESIRKIKRGPGKLLLNSKKLDCGVAVRYHYADMHIGLIRDFGWNPDNISLAHGKCRLQEAWRASAFMIDDTCTPFRWMQARDIASGALAGMKLLFLPFSQGISDREANAIREFVRAGGCVVADVRPAICTAHGKLRKAGALDDVFGVKWDPAAKPAAPAHTKVSWKGWAAAVTKTNLLPECQVDRGVKLNGAQAMGSTEGGTPIVIQNNYGKGRAVLLNFMVDYGAPQYWNHRQPQPVRNTAAGDVYAQILAAVLAQAKVDPGVRITSSETAVPRVDLDIYAMDDARFYGMVNNDDSGSFDLIYEWLSGLRATFKNKRHLYDVIGRRYLGYSDSINFAIEPGGAKLYAAMPYKVEALKVEANGMTITAAVAGGGRKPGRHVFHVGYATPSGRRPAIYRCNKVAPQGRLTWEFPTALNDEKGAWRVFVTDAASGARGSTTFHR